MSFRSCQWRVPGSRCTSRNPWRIALWKNRFHVTPLKTNSTMNMFHCKEWTWRRLSRNGPTQNRPQSRDQRPGGLDKRLKKMVDASGFACPEVPGGPTGLRHNRFEFLGLHRVNVEKALRRFENREAAATRKCDSRRRARHAPLLDLTTSNRRQFLDHSILEHRRRSWTDICALKHSYELLSPCF